MGMSLRRGCTIDPSGFPNPVPPGQGQQVVGPVVGYRLLAGQHLADDVDVLAGTRERLRERLAVPAFDHLGARTPRPSTKRPPERVVPAVLAPAMPMAVGVRAELSEVPSRTRSVREPHQANGVKASEPQDSAVHTESKPRRSASSTHSMASGGGPAPQ